MSEPAPDNHPTYIIIRGKTTDGNKFRPSDWCDRLHNTLQVLGEEAEYYSNFVQLANIANEKCLVIKLELEEINSRLYTFFIRFSADNNLTTETITEEYWQSIHRD